jgi:hypothetical protein
MTMPVLLMLVMGTLICFLITSTRIQALAQRRGDRTGPPQQRQFQKGGHPFSIRQMTGVGHCNLYLSPRKGRIMGL